MKKIICIMSLMLAAATSIIAQQTEFPNLTGPYLGQKPPGMTPKIFAPGIVSTDDHEFSCAFSPDGNEFYFSRMVKSSGAQHIMYSKLTEDGWSKPVKVNNYTSFEPFISRDGQRLYFNSWKSVPGRKENSCDIWYSERTKSGWGEPKHLGFPFNPGKAMSVTETSDRTIYVTDLTGGFERMGISRSKYINGKYSEYENLKEPLNYGKGDSYPFISPDESFMIFSSKHPSGKQGSFLFITYKNKKGKWNKPEFIDTGMDVNNFGVLSPDGKYLFFTSKGDIYWVDAKIIETLRPKE